MCFSCFMRNANTKCPMCRFNYKSMRPDGAEPDRLTMRLDGAEPDRSPIIPVENYQQFEPNQDIEFIDNWWVRLKHLIPAMLPVIRREVFEKRLNLTNIVDQHLTIDFVWTSDVITQNESLANKIIDLDSNYNMCARMYLTKMLVSFAEIEEDDYIDFVSSVNDFIQHEYDNLRWPTP